ncbi:MAG TPA: glycosyltransferase [Bryobacteraceae bacterium]|nr:glycosyltransferase [Bryobacteraceae bacterium]
MTILSFAEGAHPHKGRLNLVGAPLILASLAERGHSAILALGGPPATGTQHFAAAGLPDALSRKQGAGTFASIPFNAWTPWAFAPNMCKLGHTVRESDFVLLHSLYSFPVLAGALLARAYRKPYGIWFHGVLAPVQRRISAKKKWLYNKIAADRILAHASVLFYTARGERKEAEELHLTAPSVVIPLGIDTGQFERLPPRGSFRARFLGGFNGPLLLFLGRLNAKKGLDLLCETMAQVLARRPDCRLAIVGPADPPSFEQRVRQWVRGNGVENAVVLTGPADPQLRLYALADADLFVLPSHAENFCHAAFEAMAGQIPVVVSDTLNYAQEICRHGAGAAVPRNAQSFSSEVLRLLDEPETRRQMGANGLRLARSYSWKHTASRLERTIEHVLQQRPIPADLAEMDGASALP